MKILHCVGIVTAAILLVGATTGVKKVDHAETANARPTAGVVSKQEENIKETLAEESKSKVTTNEVVAESSTSENVAGKIAEPIKKYTTENVNLRSYPSTDDGSYETTVDYGTEVELIKDQDTWDLIKYNGTNYYVYDKYLSDTKPEPREEKVIVSNSPLIYTGSQFRSKGVAYYNGWRWTWYSQRVLPGRGLNIPGRHLDESGYVCDENNYIVVAGPVSMRGQVFTSPLGKDVKVYDYCPTNGTIDVYVGW